MIKIHGRKMLIIYIVMKCRKILIKYNAYFEKAVLHLAKIQDFIFSREKNRKLGTTF